MNRIASLLAVTLLLPGPLAWAEAGKSADLRYCLALESHQEIAKCAGEIAPGEKGKPISQEEVEMMLQKKTEAPVGAAETPGAPAPATDRPGKDVPPEKNMGSGN